jgi:RNA polymerase sigma-70 factor (ECF subfamily)
MWKRLPHKSEKSIEDFEAVVEQYYEKVFRLAYRILQRYEDAADVAQDVFLHAYRGWKYFRGESQVYTWLYRITVNLCRNKLKQQKRLQSHELPIEVGEHSDGVEGEEAFHFLDAVSVSDSPEEVATRHELMEMIEKALNDLPADYRTLITLRDIEGLSYKDIAKILGCTVTAVKAKLFRARTQLREKLLPYLKEGESDERRQDAT